MSSLGPFSTIGEMTAVFHTTATSAVSADKFISCAIDGTTISIAGFKDLKYIPSMPPDLFVGILNPNNILCRDCTKLKFACVLGKMSYYTLLSCSKLNLGFGAYASKIVANSCYTV